MATTRAGRISCSSHSWPTTASGRAASPWPANAIAASSCTTTSRAAAPLLSTWPIWRLHRAPPLQPTSLRRRSSPQCSNNTSGYRLELDELRGVSTPLANAHTLCEREQRGVVVVGHNISSHHQRPRSHLVAQFRSQL